MVVDEANHVEPIGHDARVGEVFADQRAIGGRQIHAHPTHLGLSKRGGNALLGAALVGDFAIQYFAHQRRNRPMAC